MIQDEVQRGVEERDRANYPAEEKDSGAVLRANLALWDVHLDLGLTHYHEQKFSEVLPKFHKVMERDPSNRTAKGYFPLSLAATGRCSEAISGLQRQVALDRDAKLGRIAGL